MKKIVFALLCGCLAFRIFADEPVFSLHPKMDLSLGGLALSAFTLSLFLQPEAPGLDLSGLPLDPGAVNPFDRPFVFSYSRWPDRTGTAAAYALVLLPAAALWGRRNDPGLWRDRLVPYAVMYAEAAALTWATKDLLKFAVERRRPYLYRDSSIPKGDEEDYFNSFPSGHTSLAFLGASFFSAVFAGEYPDSSLRLPLSIAAYAAASGVGLSRIASGNHFLTDVLAGAAIGLFYGHLIPLLHHQKTPAARNGQTLLAGGRFALLPVPGGVTVGVYF
jgi:undecaprenyl-diphosphatase